MRLYNDSIRGYMDACAGNLVVETICAIKSECHCIAENASVRKQRRTGIPSYSCKSNGIRSAHAMVQSPINALGCNMHQYGFMLSDAGVQERVEMLESICNGTKKSINDLSHRMNELEPKEEALRARMASLEDTGERGIRIAKLEENLAQVNRQCKEGSETRASLGEASEKMRKQIGDLWNGQRSLSERIRSVEDNKALSSSLESMKRDFGDSLEALRSKVKELEPLQHDMDTLRQNEKLISEKYDAFQERFRNLERRVADSESGIASVSSDVSQQLEDARKLRQELESSSAQAQRVADELKPRVRFQFFFSFFLFKRRGPYAQVRPTSDI